jgi:polysaccharide biosynthesis/export protein
MRSTPTARADFALPTPNRRPEAAPLPRRAPARATLPARVAGAALALLVCVGCGGSQSKFDFAAERRATSSYTVGPGDVLQVNAWKNEGLTQRMTVRPDGFISMPLIGDVQAGGRTVDAIARDIAARATKFYNEAPVISVDVAELHSYRIYVLGEVARPGEFTPKGQVTVLQAIALAGGFTRFAAPDNITIVRRDASGERRIPFHYDDVVDDGQLQANLPLQTNDTLVVP